MSSRPGRRQGRKGGTQRALLLGGIGLGGRGQAVLREILDQPDVQFLVICDIIRQPARSRQELVDTKYGNADCTMSRDLRGFLAERTDIDALLIATGDRWHALASSWRCGREGCLLRKALLDDHCEGQLVVETLAVTRGSIRAAPRAPACNRVFGIELARSGRLGNLHTAYAQIAPWGDAMMLRDWLPAEPAAGTRGTRLGAWLGPAPGGLQLRLRPRRVAHSLRFPYRLNRRMGAHTIMQVQAGIDARNTLRRRVRTRQSSHRDGLSRTMPRRENDPLPPTGVLGQLCRPAVRRLRCLDRQSGGEHGQCGILPSRC